METRDGKKISIAFHISSKVKGKEFKGERVFPVYARINFLGGNTNHRVTDRNGNLVYTTKEVFDQFINNYNSEHIALNQINWTQPLNILLDREELYKEAVILEYEEQKKKFDFKQFSAKLRLWETYIQQVLFEKISSELDSFIEKNVEDYNQFIELNSKLFLNGSQTEFNKWKEAFFSKKKFIPREIIKKIEAYLLYFFFIIYISNPDNKFMISSNYVRKPNNFLTVFSWLFKNDQDLFLEIIPNIKEGNIYSNLRVYYAQEFIDTIFPNQKNVKEYIGIINQILNKKMIE